MKPKISELYFLKSVYDLKYAWYEAETTYTDSENKNNCKDNGRTLITVTPNPTSFENCKAKCDEKLGWDFTSVDPPTNFDVA